MNTSINNQNINTGTTDGETHKVPDFTDEALAEFEKFKEDLTTAVTQVVTGVKSVKDNIKHVNSKTLITAAAKGIKKTRNVMDTKSLKIGIGGTVLGVKKGSKSLKDIIKKGSEGLTKQLEEMQKDFKEGWNA